MKRSILYQVNLLDSLDDIYNHIDRSQLTTDFGGTLEYNHLAWVDFQRVNDLALDVYLKHLIFPVVHIGIS